MSNKSSIKKARNLHELSGAGRQHVSAVDSLKAGPGADQQFARIKMERDKRFDEFQIELKAKYMTEEQIDALLSFYQSEIGISILQAQENIRNEFAANYSKRITDDQNETGESGWVLYMGEALDDDDT